LLTLTFVLTLSLSAQVMQGPTTIRQNVHHDVSLPLSEMIKNAPALPLTIPEAEPMKLIPLPPGLFPLTEDPVRQGLAPPVTPSPAVGLSFEGLGQGQYGFSVPAIPPDTNGAVGATQYIQWVNSSFAIFNKNTGALIAGPTPGNTLWSGFGGGCETNNDGDPVVQYDKLANRWVMSQFSVSTTPYLQCVAVSKTSGGTYIHRIHAVNLTTGAELFGGPTTITATYPGTGANSSNGNVVFDPAQYNERPGLLEVGGTIYTTWGSHCDSGPYTSWVMAYSADTLAQTNVLNMVPNGNDGGIWMAGTAPAADASGNIYFIIGNGDFGTTLDSKGFPANKNCGNCFAKISSSAPLTLLDYFTPLNTVSESNADTDFGSGGPLLLPDVVDSNGTTRHLAVGSGKDSIIYVVDRDNMGKFNASQDNIYQQITGQISGGVWSKPSYFNGTVYYGSVGDSIKAFPISGGKLATSPSSHSTHTFGYPGATPAISANGSSNGIVWVVENGGTGVLHAYDATNLATELYNSNQAANSRDQFSGNKFITPMIVNGKVYVGTQNSVAAFGLLP
jgi:hypothetical protein